MKTPLRLPRLRRPLFLERFHRRCGRFSAPVAALAAVGLALMPPHGLALPAGGQLVAGNVTATVNGAQLTLDQATRTAIMNWQSFNIAPNELVRLLQPGADAALLARVTGGNPTELLGRLQADGKLFLLNPKGILVGPGAIIDTAAFMASTLDVADADFLKQGPLTFKGDSAAGVVNLGQITAREGNVLLLAHTVKNAGEIAAPNGTAGLGAGTEVYLASPDAPMFVIRTNLASPAAKEGAPSVALAKEGVDNSGTIAAAQAQLEAAGGSIYDLAVNQTGLVQATGFERGPDGRVILIAAGGTVSVGGTVTARRADGSGGEILVGGDYQGGNAAVANAARTAVGAGAVLDASASAPAGHGGRVIVWADGATNFAGALTVRGGASGGDGGLAEVSGRRALNFTGTAELGATGGKPGTLLLDPDNLTIVAGGGMTPAALSDREWGFAEDPGAQTIGASVIAGLLLSGNVSLQATQTLKVNAPLIVGNGGDPNATLGLTAPDLQINAGISLANAANGQVQLFPVSSGPTTVTSAAGATIDAKQVFVGEFETVNLAGPVAAGRLIFEAATGAASFTAANPANTIADLQLAIDSNSAIAFTGDVDVRSASAMSVGGFVSAANAITIAAAGDLTMKAAGAQFAAANSIRLAATDGGVFINNAGTSLLSGAGRRLIYTSSVSGGFTLGGLSYPQFDGVAFPDDAQPGQLTALYHAGGGTPSPQPLLTITADSFTRLYGQPDPVFTASYSGGTAADLRALPTFSIVEGSHVNVGRYTILPSGALSDSHALDYVSGTLTIDPATLTYVANPFTRTYGAFNPALGGTVTGFVLGDTLASATTGTLAFSSATDAKSNVGTYTITGAGLVANGGNYIFAQAPANATALTINPATLTYAAQAASRSYGDPNPAFAGTVSGFVGGDTLASATTGTLAFATAATTVSKVGAYAIEGGGLAANHGNYVFAQAPANATAFTVLPAELTYVATPATRIYGDPNPVFGGTVTGFKLGETLASATEGNLVFASAATSAATGIGSYAIAGSGLKATNYVFTQAPANATALTIAKAPLTVQVANATRTYGASEPTLALASATGLKNGDTLGVVTNLSLTSQASNTSPTGNYAIEATGTAANYNVTFAPGALLVLPAPLMVQANNYTATYGDPLPPLSAFGYTLSGLLPFDSPGVVTGVAVVPPPLSGRDAPGTYALTVTVPAGAARNYVIVPLSGTLTLTRRPIVIAAEPAQSVAGAIPKSFAVTAPAPIAGGPQYTAIGQTSATNKSAAGAYPITPSLVFPSGTTPEDFSRFYTLTAVSSTLTLAESPVNTVTFTQGSLAAGLTADPNATTTVQVEIGKGATSIDPNAIDLTAAIGVKLKAGSPVMTSVVIDAAAGFGADLLANVDAIMNGSAGYTFTAEQTALLQQIKAGKLSPAGLAALAQRDLTAQSILLPLLAIELKDALEHGRPLTASQEAVVARVVDRMNEKRQTLVETLVAWRTDFEKTKAEIVKTNPFAVVTMPDLAGQIETELDAKTMAAGAIVGGGGGLVVGAAAGLGAAALAALKPLSGTILVDGFLIEVMQTEVTAAGAGGSLAAAGIGLAVALGVVTGMTGVMAVKEMDALKAYDQALQRAQTKVNADLAGFAWGDAMAAGDFAKAFVVTMLETGFQVKTPTR